MNATERQILSIRTDTERARAVAQYLDQKQPTPAFVDALGNDRYDVIRVEALDCAISGQKQLNREVVRQMVQADQSELVRGRLKLYLQLQGLIEELTTVRRRSASNTSARDDPWDRACDYCERRNGQSFLAMARLLFEDDYGVAGTALDLMVLLMTGIHRKLLGTAVAVAAGTPGVRISDERLTATREILAKESAPPPSIGNIKAQLS